MSENICGTCKWFLVPKSWVGLEYAGKDTQIGLCEIATPSIPRCVEFKRLTQVGDKWAHCPTWEANP